MLLSLIGCGCICESDSEMKKMYMKERGRETKLIISEALDYMCLIHSMLITIPDKYMLVHALSKRAIIE